MALSQMNTLLVLRLRNPLTIIHFCFSMLFFSFAPNQKKLLIENRSSLYSTSWKKAGWMDTVRQRWILIWPIMRRTLVSEHFISVPLLSILTSPESSCEGRQTAPWRCWMTLLCFFETTITTYILPSRYSFQRKSSAPPYYLTLVWHLWAITINFSYKAGQQRKWLYWRWQCGSAGCATGRQEGGMEGCWGGLFMSPGEATLDETLIVAATFLSPCGEH